MLKTLGVRLEEDFIKQVKMLAIQQGISVQEYVRLALVSYGSEPSNEPTQELQPLAPLTIEPAPVYTPDPDFVDPFSDPDPMDERYFYILRKTFMTDLPEDDDYWATNSAVGWTIPAGGCKHYDRESCLIPFRYTTPEGYVVQPTQEQLDKLAKVYGKPVTVEK